MKVRDVIAEIRASVNELEEVNSHFTDTDVITWLNECTLNLLASLGTYPYENTTITSAAGDLVLSSKYLAVETAHITNPDNTHRRLETIDFPNFQHKFKNWLDQQADVPTHLVRKTDSEWFLYPQPNADYLAKDIVIYAKTLPDELTTSTDTLPFSPALHPVYIFFGLWKAYIVLNNNEKAASAYSTFDGLRVKMQGLATNTIGQRKKLHW